MSDILRVAALNPDFLAALNVHLVEISPVLRSRQQQTLSAAGVEIHWHETLTDIPDGPLLLVANEFFDALPVRQYAGHRGKWQERRIGLSDDGSLAFTLGARTLECALQPVDGAIVEVSPVSSAIMNDLADCIGKHGGAALIIDYGHTETAAGETLQAVQKHQYADPLAGPGDADLTAHVDFAALQAACAGTGAVCHGPMTQGDFLVALGLLERAGQLGRDMDEAARETVRNAVERLAGPDQMGQLFKVLAVTDKGIGPLPFSAAPSADPSATHEAD